MMINFILKWIHVFITPRNKTIIYHSFPDVSDNSFSFFIYILNTHPESVSYTHLTLPTKA